MGGAEFFWIDLLNEWDREKKSLRLVTNQKKLQAAVHRTVQLEEWNWPVDLVGNWKGLVKSLLMGPLALVKTWILLKKIKREGGIVIMSGFSEKLLVAAANVWWKVPVIWIEFASVKVLTRKWGEWLEKWYEWAARDVRVVITSSHHSFKRLSREQPYLSKKIKMLPCGKDLTTFAHITQNNQVEANTVVCVSRLEPGKGQDVLIRAFVKVVKQNPQAKLRIVGEGDFDSQLRKLIAEYDLNQNVTLTGWVPNALIELAKSEVVVFPSMWELEGFGMVTLEAMALGKVVIAFDTGPTPDLLENNQTGVLVKAGDADALAKKILKLLHDKKLAKKIGGLARERAYEKYSISVVARQYLQTITEVCI
jgi:glycosyltransferase involved in cell wall biosynthesis